MDERYLLDVACRVLAFAQRTAERFALLASHWPTERGDRESQLDKILGEASMLLLVVTRAARHHPALQSSVAALGQTLSPLVRSERGRVLLLRSQRSGATLLMPHLLLTLSGYPDLSFNHILERERTDDWRGGERVAFRIAEARWLWAMVEGTHMVFDDLLPFSVFAGDMDPFEMDRMDLYAVTHWLMYASDFGAAELPSSIRVPAITLLDGAIAWQLAAEDLDLLGELLISACVLRTGWSHHLTGAWSVLTAAWDELGFVPSPSFRAKDFQVLSGDSQEAYAVANIYHTQFVFGMLAALLLQSTPPKDDEKFIAPEAPSVREVADACLETVARVAAFVGDAKISIPEMPAHCDQTSGSCWTVLAALGSKENQHLPFWMKAISHMPETERSRVGVDALLVQAVRRYDLDAVAKLLSLVMSESVVPSGVYRQALLWLTRQQTPEGAIGAHFVNRENLNTPEARMVSGCISNLLSRAAIYLNADYEERRGHRSA